MGKAAENLELPENVTAFSLFALGDPAGRRAWDDRFDAFRIHFCGGTGMTQSRMTGFPRLDIEFRCFRNIKANPIGLAFLA